jgi:hypothetical protein
MTKKRQLGLHNVPRLIWINSRIAVNEDIAKADDRSPVGDAFRSHRIEATDLRKSFADNFKAALDRPTKLLVNAILLNRFIARKPDDFSAAWRMSSRSLHDSGSIKELTMLRCHLGKIRIIDGSRFNEID